MNVCDKQHVYPLHLAAMYGQLECLHMLLFAGAEARVRDGDQRGPLSWASQANQTDCAKALIAAGEEGKYNCESVCVCVHAYLRMCVCQSHFSFLLSSPERLSGENMSVLGCGTRTC